VETFCSNHITQVSKKRLLGWHLNPGSLVPPPPIEMGSCYTNPPYPKTKHVKFSKLKCYYFYAGEGKQCNAEKFSFTLTVTQLCT